MNLILIKMIFIKSLRIEYFKFLNIFSQILDFKARDFFIFFKKN